MVLSATEIKKCVALGEIFIDPLDESSLKAASYTLALGARLRKLKAAPFIDTRLGAPEFEEVAMGEDGYTLAPGEFVICHTEEAFKLGEGYACFLSVRGSKAQMGLDALQSEIFCEPGSEGGWKGKLALETSKRGQYPIRIFPGIRIVKGIFMKVM